MNEKSRTSELEEILRNLRAAKEATYEILNPEDRIAMDTVVAAVEEALERSIFARL